MVLIIIYLVLILIAIGILSILQYISTVPLWYSNNLLFIQSALMGALGGILYCLRGIYTNKCVKKRWDIDWTVWYYLRPLTSLISGFVSCFLLKAGLLVLDSSKEGLHTNFGFYIIAFIAGYNVDNFLKKIESIAKTTWGIEPSLTSKGDANTKKDELKK